jgi:hypothetical protein
LTPGHWDPRGGPWDRAPPNWPNPQAGPGTRPGVHQAPGKRSRAWVSPIQKPSHSSALETRPVYNPETSKRKFSVATSNVPRFAGARRKKIYQNFSWSGIEFSRDSLKPDWLQIIMTPEKVRHKRWQSTPNAFEKSFLYRAPTFTTPVLIFRSQT